MLKPYLRVFRGISKTNLPGYVGFFQFRRNYRQLTALEQAELILFHALGIYRFDWERDPAGYHRGSAGLIMRPIDVAKFGQLYLQNGLWNGQHLISQDWVEQSTTIRVHLPTREGYGRLWWVEDDGHTRRFSGIGYGAQYLTVVPSLDLVVVANHDFIVSEGLATQQENEFTRRVLNPIIAAAQG